MRPSAQLASLVWPGRFVVSGFGLLLALGCGGTARTLPTRPEAPIRVPLRLDDAPPPPDDLAADLLERHNRIRIDRDLPPLSYSPKLTQAAREQVSGMIAMGKIRHKGTDGSKPSDRVERAGYRFVTVGENVASGQETAEEVMEGWMNSPGHKRNILGEFRELGASKAEDDEGLAYWCVVFASPLPRLDPAEAAEALRLRINMLRAEDDLPPLAVDPSLAAIAGNQASSMAEADSLEPGGAPLGELLKEQGVSFRNVSRVVMAGSPGAAEVLRSLKENEQHRELLLGSFDAVGIGYATSAQAGRPYWTVLLVDSGEKETP